MTIRWIALLFLAFATAQSGYAQQVTPLTPEQLKLFPPGVDPVWAAQVLAKEQAVMEWRLNPPKPAGTAKTAAAEQDCPFAIPVCQQTYSQPNSYTGPGSTQEVPRTSCLSQGERASVWYVFTVQTSGTLSFNITPVNLGDDYDFALYDLTGRTCPDITSGAAPEVRCNFASDRGVTGLSTQGTSASEGAGGNRFSSVLNVTAGQTYVLVVDNYSMSQSGYSLTFGGTASIFDNIPPTPRTVQAPCNENFLTLTMSEPVLCNSVASNGSDFTLTGPGGPFTILAANGLNCGNFDSQIEIAFNPPLLTDSTYTLTINTGADGNTLIDNCGNAATAGTQITFRPTLVLTIQGSASVCAGNPVTLTASTGQTFLWNTGATTRSIVVTPTAVTTYTVAVTSGDCSGNAQITVTPRPGHVARFNATTVCVGQPTTFRNTSVLVQQCPFPFFCIPNPAIFNLTFGTGNPQDVFFAAQVFPTLPGIPPLFQFDSTTFTYNAPGVYEAIMTVADSTAGCTSVFRQMVTVLDTNARPVITGDSVVCNGATAVLSATGTSRYQWPNGSTAPTYSITPTQDTLITLIGFNDCSVPPRQYTTTKLVRVVAAPIVDAGPDTLDACPGAPINLSGSVLNAGGGVWVGGNGAISPNRDSLNITYTPTATDIALGGVGLRLLSTGNGPGCTTAQDRIFIRIGSSLPAPVAACGNGGNGNVVFNWGAVGGANSYEVSTDGGLTFGPPSSGAIGTTHTVSGVPSTDSVTLVVRAIGSGTCGTSPLSTPVTCFPCAATPTPVVTCGNGGGDTVSFVWNASPNVTAYEVSTDGGSTYISVGLDTTYTTIGVASGDSVTIRVRARGCGLGQPSAPVTCYTCALVTVNVGPDDTLCAGDSTTILASISGGSGNYILSWTGGLPATAGPHRVVVSQTQTYVLTVIDADNPACPARRDSITLTAAPLPEVVITVTPPLPADLRTEDAELTFSATNNGTDVRLDWVFGDGGTATDNLVPSSSQNRVHRYGIEGTYEPYVVRTTPAGCADTVRFGVVRVQDRELIFIPNVFTPNADGINDLFNIQYQGFTSYKIVIFDRWGTEVFNNNYNPQLFWNGLKQNDGGACPEGVYVFRLEAQGRDSVYERSGSITLLR